MQGAQTRLRLSEEEQALVLELMHTFSTTCRRVYQQVSTGQSTLEEALHELATKKVLTHKQRDSVGSRVEQWLVTDRETLKYRIGQKQARVESLGAFVKDLRAQLKKAEASVHTSPKRLATLKALVFQKHRAWKVGDHELSVLQADLEASRFHRVFGGKKRLRQRHLLQEASSPYEDENDWRQEWEQSRNGEVWLLGDGSATGGNQSAQLDLTQHTLTLRLTETQAQHRLQAEANRLGVPVEKVPGKLLFKRLTLHNVTFTPKMDAELRQAQALGLPITVSLKQKLSPKGKSDIGFYLHASYTLPKPVSITSRHQGVLGVDVNAWGLAWCISTPDGNVMKAKSEQGEPGQALKGNLALKLRHLSSDQAHAAVLAATNTLVGLAETFKVGMACEDLDFSDAKAGLREKGRAYARMLSGLRTAGLADALASRCRKRGIPLDKVDPSWTSIAGFAKYGLRNGLSIDQASAFAVARKSLLGRHATAKPLPTHNQSGKKLSPAFVRKLQAKRDQYTVRHHESVRFAQPLPLEIQRNLKGYKVLTWRHVRKVLGTRRKDWVRNLTQSPAGVRRLTGSRPGSPLPGPQRTAPAASGSRNLSRETTSASRLSRTESDVPLSTDSRNG